MQPPSHDQPTARPLFVIGLGMVALWVLMAFLLVGCASKPLVVQAVDVQPAMRQVDEATRLSTDARGAVSRARREAAAPAPDMERIRAELSRADVLLANQHQALTAAQNELQAAHQAAALSAKEMARIKAESDKWRVKHEQVKKYRFLVISLLIGAVLVIASKMRGFFI